MLQPCRVVARGCVQNGWAAMKEMALLRLPSAFPGKKQHAGGESESGVVFLIFQVQREAKAMRRCLPRGFQPRPNGGDLIGVRSVSRKQAAQMLLFQLNHRQVDE